MRKMMTKSTVMGISLFLLFVVGCCYPVRYDGPYKGKVIDADTGKPIEGVVVLGVWYKEIATAAGGVSSYYDADETVTNKEGEFEIKCKGLRILTNIGPMNVLIVKASYEYVGMYPWETLKVDPRNITWEGEKAIIPLRKLMMEERKKRSGPPDPPSEASLNKVILLLKEIDKDDRERGLKTRGIWKGEKYE